MVKETEYCPACGFVLKKPRSPKAHRHFFAVIDAAHENWPEDHEFQPTSPEHLRAWLLVRTGYADTIGNLLDMRRPTMEKLEDFLEMCLVAMKNRGYVFPAERDGYLEAHFPKSIAYAELDQKEFAPIAEAVFAEIEKHIGLPIKEILRHVTIRRGSKGRSHHQSA